MWPQLLALGSLALPSLAFSDDCHGARTSGNFSVEQVAWFCDREEAMANGASHPPALTPHQWTYLQSLAVPLRELRKPTRRRVKRQTSGMLVRKEYRMLSDEERQRLHAAMNRLKKDFVDGPSSFASTFSIRFKSIVLFDGLVEGGREAAAPILRLLDSPYFDVSWAIGGRMSVAAREELFAEASLDRLRSFFLRSKDPVGQRAFLRLLHLATKDLWWLKWRCMGEGDTILINPAFIWELAPVQENDGPDVPLIRGQFHLLQRLLRDRFFLAKVRESAWGGGEGSALEEACDVYAELAYPSRVVAEGYEAWRGDYGVQFVLRPLLPGLARRWDELSDSVKGRLSGVRVLLFAGEGPEGAADGVEGCVVPLLRDAHRIPLVCLRWLTNAFIGRRFTASPPYPFPFFYLKLDYDFSSPRGSALRDSVWRALKTGLGRVDLGPDKAWLLLGSVWNPAKVRDPELRLAIVETWWRLPLSLASREKAAWVLHQLLEVPSVDAVGGWLVGRGAFAMAERLLRLHVPPFHLTAYFAWDECDEFSGNLVRIIRYLPKLLQPSLVPPHDQGPLEPREETRRLMAWREQGLGPALRALLPHEPALNSTDLRPDARTLLDLADGLLRQQPGIRYASNLPNEIRFPEW